jgi:hypothetical protein
MDAPQTRFSRQQRDWIIILLVSVFGSAFAILVFALLASDGFSAPDANLLDWICIGFTLTCPFALAATLFWRKRFFQLSSGRRLLAIACVALLPLPVIALMLLHIFGHYK